MPVSSYFLADAAPAAPAFTRARTGKQNPAEPMVNAAARIGRGAKKLQFWDSIILSAAAEAGCTLLLSEDMLDGFVIRGVAIVNPLADKLHENLARLLA